MTRGLPLAILAAACAACRPVGPDERLPPGDYTPRELETALELPPERLAAVRQDALQRARVWREPPVPIEQADLFANPAGDGAFPADAQVLCKYHLKTTVGYSPKFHCVLPGGDVVKVKYGRAGRETRTEVAATRLLSALGFGADRMYVVSRVRCFGCPLYPHSKLSWWNSLFVNYGRYHDFDFVSIERPLEGQRLEVPEKEGWGWEELAQVDPARGGSSRAEVDALRLMAAFLGHWDAKYSNQRLLCLSEGGAPPPAASDACPRPLAYIQDLGGTFGPHALDLRAWRSRPVFADAAACMVSMRSMPYQGATFVDASITESGRRFLAERLSRLSRQQITHMFEAARFTDFPHDDPDARDVNRWVDAFLDKVRQIADRQPCPQP